MVLDIRTSKRKDGTWAAWLSDLPKLKVCGVNQSEAVGRLLLAKSRHVNQHVRIRRLQKEPRIGIS